MLITPCYAIAGCCRYLMLSRFRREFHFSLPPLSPFFHTLKMLPLFAAVDMRDRRACRLRLMPCRLTMLRHISYIRRRFLR